jgi:uncharacterized protein YkwD
MRSKSLLTTAAASLMLVLPSHADAGHRRARRAACQGTSCRAYAAPAAAPQPQPRYVHPMYYAPTAQAPAVQAAPAPASPGGFSAWVNGQRAAHGLPPIAEDGALSQQAAVNSSRGFGHSYMGSARRQNAGVGGPSQVWAAWMASPAHRDAILDPTITRFGIAVVGGVWTYSAY